MGGAKRELERAQDLEAQATIPLVKAGALEPCGLHEDVLIIQRDSQKERAAYAIGTNMVKAGEVDGTREEFMDAIKGAIESATDECYICANYRDD